MPVVELVGWVGSALLIVSLLQTRVMRFRVLNAISCVVLVGYNAVVGVWPMVAMNVVLVGINLFVITRLLRQRHDERVYEVTPIGVTEPYLSRLLERHASDIREFNPTLPPTLPTDVATLAEHAFLVTTKDEVVGVVLSRPGGVEGEQQIVLDYVLPPYRDFTPGEFVFRPDGPFASLGTRRVVASPGMAADPRYARAVGFVQQGDAHVLDLRPA